MNRRLRAASLPAVALVLVTGVLAIQLAYGGGTYEPLRAGRPLRGADRHLAVRGDRRPHRASRAHRRRRCRLQPGRQPRGVHPRARRRPAPRTDAEIDALRQGLLSAVGQMEDDGSLPPASELVDEALDSADLNDFLETLIRALPDSVIDAALKTDDVLTRAIEDLDLRTLLANLDDQDDLNAQVEAAVTQAVKDSLADRLRDLL